MKYVYQWKLAISINSINLRSHITKLWILINRAHSIIRPEIARTVWLQQYVWLGTRLYDQNTIRASNTNEDLWLYYKKRIW